MFRFPVRSLQAAFALATALAASTAGSATADEAQIQRGKYLVTIAGCSDCHTPGGLLGHSDMARYLAGSDVGFSIPGAGIFIGQNLTPDKETGIGDWSADQIVAAIRTGKTPDGRMLSGVMPYPAYSHLTDEDAQAIAAFLKSLPAVKNKVVGPLKPTEKADVYVSVILPAQAYNSLPAPKK
jgi:mono/diheme cytochrome c family protein